jgi:hypothetical protein
MAWVMMKKMRIPRAEGAEKVPAVSALLTVYAVSILGKSFVLVVYYTEPEGRRFPSVSPAKQADHFHPYYRI